MRQLNLNLVFSIFLIFGLLNSINSQTILRDGIYQIKENGIRILFVGKVAIPHRDIIIKDDSTYMSNEVKMIEVDSTSSYLIDSIPSIIFDDFKKARLEYLTYNNKPVLAITINDSVISKFAKLTSSNIGKPLLIVNNNKIIFAPMVNSEVTSGRIDITGLDEELIKSIVKKINK